MQARFRAPMEDPSEFAFSPMVACFTRSWSPSYRTIRSRFPRSAGMAGRRPASLNLHGNCRIPAVPRRRPTRTMRTRGSLEFASASWSLGLWHQPTGLACHARVDPSADGSLSASLTSANAVVRRSEKSPRGSLSRFGRHHRLAPLPWAIPRRYPATSLRSQSWPPPPAAHIGMCSNRRS